MTGADAVLRPMPEDGEVHPDPLRVLVVDDSRLQRHILAAQLHAAGHLVFEAAGGDEALAWCAGNPVDVIISDWMMPGMSGPELLRRFRGMGRGKYTYFILLTCDAGQGRAVSGLDLGADDFMAKPVTGRELHARIRAGARLVAMQRRLEARNSELRAALAELRSIQDGLDRDLSEARQLQESLVAERQHRFDGACVTLLWAPSGHVGGDLVGCYAIDAARIGVYALDVSGHGVSAALMTARLAGCLSGHVPAHNLALRRTPGGGYEPRPPEQVLALLNAAVLRHMPTEHYLTILLAEIDLRSGTVAIAQAGHPHPMVQRCDGRVEVHRAGGMPVGLIASPCFASLDLRLRPGDRLLFVSDGVTECAGRDNELLGEKGLERFLGRHRSLRGEQLTDMLLRELRGHMGRDAFSDDVSALLVEYQGQR